MRRQVLTPEQKQRKSDLQKQRRQSDPLGYRNNNLKTRYGIDHREYLDRLKQQGNECGICGSTTSRSASAERFAIDHDHKTGIVRGILCHPCNWALGYLYDNPNLFKKAAQYLESCSIGCWEDLPW